MHLLRVHGEKPVYDLLTSSQLKPAEELNSFICRTLKIEGDAMKRTIRHQREFTPAENKCGSVESATNEMAAIEQNPIFRAKNLVFNGFALCGHIDLLEWRE
jgi:hypothetical protein